MDEKTEQDKQKLRRLKAIFDGDGTDIRRQLIYAGLLLTIIERLKTYVIDHVDGFFSEDIRIEGGTLKYRRGEQFKKLIKKHGTGDPGQHNNQVFRAALRWFQECGAINAEEFDEIERLYALRNEIGHELLLILAEDSRQPITIYDVLLIFSSYVKISRWWVKEIDLTTDPDMTKERYDSIEGEDIEILDTMLIREIFNKALDSDPIWREIQKTAARASRNQ